jgi:cytochrome c oxidase assembly protein subunit 15
MVVVILEGAIVRATGSGAGCGNHWPLCNGQVIPVHPRVATIIEFVHRQLTTVCSLLVVALITLTFVVHGRSKTLKTLGLFLVGLIVDALFCRWLYEIGSTRLSIIIAVIYPLALLILAMNWTLRAKNREDRAGRAAVWSGILLLMEAFLGAVLVKGGYVEANASDMRVLVQCIHFTNTMLLMGALTLAWWWSRSRTPIASASSLSPSSLSPVQIPSSTRPLAWLALAATLLVGATGSVAALADTLFPSPTLTYALQQDFAANAPLLIRMRWLHPAAAIVGLAAAIGLSLLLRGKAARWLLTLIAAQFVLGTADVLLLAPTWLQVLHLLGADLYWIALVAVSVGILLPDPTRT